MGIRKGFVGRGSRRKERGREGQQVGLLQCSAQGKNRRVVKFIHLGGRRPAFRQQAGAAAGSAPPRQGAVRPAAGVSPPPGVLQVASCQSRSSILSNRWFSSAFVSIMSAFVSLMSALMSAFRSFISL